MKQKDAVFQAVCAITGMTEFDGPVSLTSEQRAQVNNVVCEGFKALTVDLDRSFTDAELKKYTSGLISNWLRRDTRLNGGTKYQAKNPGSRAGSSDPQLKAMRALLSTVTSDEDKAEIQSHIDARVAEIGAAKVQAKPIDYSALPADLAEKFSK